MHESGRSLFFENSENAPKRLVGFIESTDRLLSFSLHVLLCEKEGRHTKSFWVHQIQGTGTVSIAVAGLGFGIG
jgi:hypothetical protein